MSRRPLSWSAQASGLHRLTILTWSAQHGALTCEVTVRVRTCHVCASACWPWADVRRQRSRMTSGWPFMPVCCRCIATHSAKACAKRARDNDMHAARNMSNDGMIPRALRWEIALAARPCSRRRSPRSCPRAISRGRGTCSRTSPSPVCRATPRTTRTHSKSSECYRDGRPRPAYTPGQCERSGSNY